MNHTTRAICGCTLSMLAITLAAPSAQAAPHHRFGAGMIFGFGGEGEQQEDVDTSGMEMGDGGDDARYDMDTSFGGVLHYRFTPTRHISLGARPGFIAWRSEPEADQDFGRNFSLHLDPYVQLQEDFGDKRHLLYVQGFFGPSMNIVSEDIQDSYDSLGLEASPRIAWRGGVVFGLMMQGGGKDPGLFIEGSFARQGIRNNVTGSFENPFSDENIEVDEMVESAFWQFGLNVGLTFAL